MRYAIIADIHSNIEALEAVLDIIRRLKADKIICCGDLVGYYANPNECIEQLTQHNVQSVAGNHDLAAAGFRELDGWEVAEKAIAWTREQLTPQSLECLRKLPATLSIDEKLLIFHGALHPKTSPENLHLFHEQDVAKSMHALLQHESGVKLAFFGHTHRPLTYQYRNEQLVTSFSQYIELEDDGYYLINPGSVGQSRDGNPAASFLIYDDASQTIRFHRVNYDVDACLRRAKQHNLLRDPPIKAIAKRAYRKAVKIVKAI